MSSSHYITGDSGIGVLSIIIFAPLLAAISLYILPSLSSKRDPNGESARIVSFSISIFTLLMTLLLFYSTVILDMPAEIQFGKRIPWIPQLGISYLIGLDGISLGLVLLTTIILPIVIIMAQPKFKFRAFFANLLVLQSALIGSLVALDLFLFYLFWELMLAPTYFLIGIWGGKRRIYATLKFVVYTVTGSVLMLVAMLYLVWHTYVNSSILTFSLDQLLSFSSLSLMEQTWLFAAFAVAFAIKVPIFPFHTWMSDVYSEGPLAVLIVSSGIMLKVGLYGLIRFAYPLFPQAAELFTPLIALLAVIGIIYGALIAWQQDDMRKLMAFSSLSHLGFCVLGVFAFQSISLTGAIFQAFCHGITAAALFIMLGILMEQGRSYKISDFGGLASVMPRFATLFLIFTLSSVALPLTNSFVGEFLILTGSFQTFPLATLLASIGVILGAIYMLSLYQRLMFGELKNNNVEAAWVDLSAKQFAVLIPLAFLVLFMGIMPSSLTATIKSSVSSYKIIVDQRKSNPITPEIKNERPSGLSNSKKNPQIASLGGVVAI
jgi:NADH-quinone oxidoreductase subunit M